jgi:hypothetical protein
MSSFKEELDFLTNIHMIIDSLKDKDISEIIKTHVNDILIISSTNRADSRQVILDKLDDLIERRLQSEVGDYDENI